MEKKIVIDTNLFLDDANIIFKLAKEYDKIIIPTTVLQELDEKKYDHALAYSARSAIYSILQFKEAYPDKILFTIEEESLNKFDKIILDAAKREQADLATKDINMSVIGEAYDIKTKLYNVVMNGLFHPYVYVQVDDVDSFTFAKKYTGLEYETLFKTLNDTQVSKLISNSWFFVMFKNQEEIVCIYANNPLTYTLERIDNVSKYRELNIEGGFHLKAMDEYQVCAFYALKEAPNVLLTGKWGSGKTLISTAYALTSNSRKTFITRPPVGINKKYDIGALPGTKEEKLIGWFAGFLSSLYYLYANTRGQSKDGVNYDFIKDRVFNEKFETVPINAIQGMSLLDGDLFIADEVQLIDIDYLSMVLSRASKGSKIILLGDLMQTYDVVRPSESGLLKLLRALPHRSLAYVELKTSFRSDLLEIADKLQDKTLG